MSTNNGRTGHDMYEKSTLPQIEESYPILKQLTHLETQRLGVTDDLQVN